MVLRRVGVTGCSGVLGSHIKAYFEFKGVDVIDVGRHTVCNENQWDLREWIDDAKFDQVFSGAEAIVLAGAIVPGTDTVGENDLFIANANSCLNVGLWAMSRELPIVYVSGGIAYRNPHACNITEDAELGWSGFGGLYGLSKLIGEDHLKRLRQAGLKLSVIRASSIYGAGIKEEKVIRKFINAALNDDKIMLRPPFSDRINLVHAHDVANAVHSILIKRAWDDFNVASHSMMSFRQLADTCVELFGGGKVLETTSEDLPRKENLTFDLNIAKAKQTLSWSPIIDLKHGLKMVNERKFLPLNI